MEWGGGATTLVMEGEMGLFDWNAIYKYKLNNNFVQIAFLFIEIAYDFSSQNSSSQNALKSHSNLERKFWGTLKIFNIIKG